MSIKIKNRKNKSAEKELAKKIGLFDKISDECLSCAAPFDKKNRDMVMSWYVVVREKEKEVNLYCPQCWSTAMQAIEEVKNEVCNT